MSGTTGKYRLDQRLGGGGMAEVFLGSTMGAEGFSRKVAIKRVLPGFSDNPSFANMFVAEATISAQLQHPNIVSVLDFDRDGDGRLFLVMELVEGRDLDALLQTGTLPFGVIAFVMTEVLRGLGHAHDLPAQTGGGGIRGIVHRDVSPHNVLLSWEGAVKVSDFGIAKARAASEATASVFIKGKPAYMSPEQANGERLDGRSDLFAVGVMLWEMLVGRRLFTGDDTRATLAAVLFGQIPRPRSLRPDVPADLEHVAMKLLERDLPARYFNAEAAIADLLECADAPKAGREMLVRTLGERFPGSAPVRSSQLHPRRHATPAPAAHDAYAATMSGVPGAPVTPMPSIGSQRNAQTATLGPGAPMKLTPTPMPMPPQMPLIAVAPPPAPPRRRTGLAVGLALAAIAGTVVVIVVVQGSGGGGTAANGAGSAGSASVAAVPPSAPIDAAIAAAAPPSVDAALTVDAAVAIATPGAGNQKDATHGHAGNRPDHGSTAAAAGPAEISGAVGFLDVDGFPIMSITVDGRRYSDTPVEVMLKPGKHLLRATNPDLNQDHTYTVTITENKHTPIDVSPPKK